MPVISNNKLSMTDGDVFLLRQDNDYYFLCWNNVEVLGLNH